jgi:hypothetical protein
MEVVEMELRWTDRHEFESFALFLESFTFGVCGCGHEIQNRQTIFLDLFGPKPG